MTGLQQIETLIDTIAGEPRTVPAIVDRAAYRVVRGALDAAVCATETSVAKLYATEAAVECANLAIQVHGGSGYVDDYPVERYLRDARVTTLYEGTSQIQKLIIGRSVTGINAMV